MTGLLGTDHGGVPPEGRGGPRDAPGRRGRFATKSAKSNDDARAVGASDGIVSLQ